MVNKTFPFILINKNNMRELLHFPDFHSMEDHLYDKQGQFIIIINECHLFSWTPKKKYDTDSDLKYYLNKSLGLSF